MKNMLNSTGHSEGPKGKIWLLPSLLTTISLLSGFYSIISAINGHYFNSAVALIVSGIFDGLDGRVARMTNTASHFGMEYDSLCDLVAFGVAPAILAYLWALEDYGRYGWLAAFLYVATTALRLARFNSQGQAGNSSKSFTGLPCPAAAGMIATSVLFCLFFQISGAVRDVLFLGLVYGLSYLMVSNVTYQSFKHAETTGARKFQALVFMVLFIMVLATEPQVTLFVLGFIYVLSGPLGAGYRLLAGLNKNEEEQEDLV
ncbi:MAG: CDP-diacylglycerol--serine O-phosphatidyltransferase [Proteobacteria bacterium]|nr:CDP-diacylglycerol--serine O-phosphatidyltransferase [Pseudomonadota bacterium]MBU1715194.1 CDP-diacylglycerol--serine O-phosphatidyltransferase [Pseudomonadota bacterium]